jgi:hypothetical protein
MVCHSVSYLPESESSRQQVCACCDKMKYVISVWSEGQEDDFCTEVIKSLQMKWNSVIYIDD